MRASPRRVRRRPLRTLRTSPGELTAECEPQRPRLTRRVRR
jgi:hypothetical protein